MLDFEAMTSEALGECVLPSVTANGELCTADKKRELVFKFKFCIKMGGLWPL